MRLSKLASVGVVELERPVFAEDEDCLSPRIPCSFLYPSEVSADVRGYSSWEEDPGRCWVSDSNPLVCLEQGSNIWNHLLYMDVGMLGKLLVV